MAHVAAAAEFAGVGRIEGDHAHALAVFFPEKHHRAGLLRLLDRNAARFFEADVFADFFVHDLLDLGQFLVGHFLEMRKVEAQGLVVEVRAFLLDVVAEHAAQGGVQQVRGRVVVLGEAALAGVHVAMHGRVLHVLRQPLHHVDHEVVFLFGVQHAHFFVAEFQPAGVAHLATAFGVKRRAVEHEVVLGLAFDLHGAVFHDVAVAQFELIVAEKLDIGFVAQHHPVAYLLGGVFAGTLFLLLQGLIKARFIHQPAFFAGDQAREVNGKTKGVVQFERLPPVNRVLLKL